ncbi:MAG: Protein lysine acetyltransferase Pat [Planctomycetes bacterium]|nr:Protein lysine acetyltransferase Pat [Planctomycetota bacterium]
MARVTAVTVRPPHPLAARRRSDDHRRMTPDDPAAARPSLDGIFRPKSVAVIGASRKRGHLARELLHNLVSFEFEGKAFPVNPGADVVHSIKCYPTVEDVPDAVDLAVIVVPREHVLAAAEACGRKGVNGLIVISSGFREVGPAGVERERELMAIVRRHGMRMIGPNCMGVINTHPAVRLNATFAPTPPLRGSVGFLSQSGAMGVAILENARRLGLGISMFASMGNKADVSGNDLLQYWEDDPETSLVLMYLESFGNPRNFTQIARRVTRKKPVVAVKAGRTAAGAAAAASHTGALAGTDVAVDALLSQCGVLRAVTVEELFDVALALHGQPLPAGRNVALLTDAGGPAIMATDALVGCGMELAKLSEATQAALADGLSPDSSVRNPVDMLGHAGGADYARCLKIILADPGVDAVICLYVPPVMHDPVEVAHAIFDAAQASPKPVLCVLMARGEVIDAVKRRGGPSLPVYEFPESAARALAAMARYRELRDRAPGEIPAFRVDAAAAGAVMEAAARQGREHLSADEAARVLAAYGIRMVPSRLARNRDELRAAVRDLGTPVVLKISSPDIVHKTEIGGVVLDVQSAAQAEVAFDALLHRARAAKPDAVIEGVVVQRMARGGHEMIVGMTTDPSFGPLLMAGFGGIHVEVLRDVAFRVHPVTDRDAAEMVQSLRGSPLLAGVRGAAPACTEAYVEALLRVDRLVHDFVGIRELDVNPFLVAETAAECMGLDARIRIDPSAFGQPA